jgi:lycopene beta-cyclase
MANHYDIVIVGGGLSGLTLATELKKQPTLRDQSVLILERDSKTANDRTWCFWAKPDEPLPPVVHCQWERSHFFGENGFATTFDLAPYRYNMIRSGDFYAWAKAFLAQQPAVDWRTVRVDKIDHATGEVLTNSGIFTGKQIFNSALLPRPLLPDASPLYPNPPFSVAAQTPIDRAAKGYTHLLQHFKGWIIRTEQPVFADGVMTLMDYRMEQGSDTRFVYVLPLAPNRALVEYTVFSPELSPAAAYDEALRLYLQQHLHLTDFHIEESEFGVIPMGDFPLGHIQEGRTVNIGTAAGFVKMSSGYAFMRTQRKIRQFVADWAKNGHFNVKLLQQNKRFALYDSVLLRVLRNGELGGGSVFTTLFSSLPPTMILRFLDEDTHLGQELRLMNTVPKLPFLRATGQVIGRR